MKRGADVRPGVAAGEARGTGRRGLSEGEWAHAGVGLVTRRCERAVGEVGVGRRGRKEKESGPPGLR